jgi:hypothetical protein
LAGGEPHGFGWPPPFVHVLCSVILASADPSSIGAIATPSTTAILAMITNVLVYITIILLSY